MRRRAFLAGAMCTITGLQAAEVRASDSCTSAGCVAQIPFAQFAPTFQLQDEPEWCWAACISMIFGYYGHPVGQERIVTEAYGAPADAPAISGFVIAQALNRSWRDDNGQWFRSSLRAVFDAQAGAHAINSAAIVQAIVSGHPLINGARGHATVVTALWYAPTRFGPAVTRVGVFDPFPGVGARSLYPDEMIPIPRGSLQFIALPTVS